MAKGKFKPLLVRFNRRERKALKDYGRFHKLSEASVVRALVADLMADMSSFS